MTITRLLARPMLASMFVVGGVGALRDAEARAVKAAPVTEKLTPLAERVLPNAPIPTLRARRACPTRSGRARRAAG